MVALSDPAKFAVDLVMEGGGVKGIGLVGALEVLEQQYDFRRIAGSSIGAMIGALLASGMTAQEIEALLDETDLKQFRDPNILSRLGTLGQGAALLFSHGLYKGNNLHKWIARTLKTHGIRTFADLKLHDDWAEGLPPEQRYKLVVMVADIGRGRLLRLPWDYPLLGRKPDTQLVADAIRASASIPFFYEPVRIDKTFLLDGGLLSNFPVDIFDTYPTLDAWPTFGVKLSSKEDADAISSNVNDILGFPSAVIRTLINAYDQYHLDNPETTQRTIFVDSADIKVTDFDITALEKEILKENGRIAARKFLATWDFTQYLRETSQ